MASPRFRPAVLLEARERAKLTQLQLATLAESTTQRRHSGSTRTRAAETSRRIRTWESRIGAWERGVDAPSAPYIPTLARLLDLEPLSLFEVDPAGAAIYGEGLAAGLTLQALADAVGLSYTSLYRMVRGVTQMPDGVAGRLTNNLGVTRVRSWWRRSHGTGSTSDDRGGKEHHSDRGTVGKQRLPGAAAGEGC